MMTLALAATFLAASVRAEEPPVQPQPAPELPLLFDFEMEDQFGAVHRRADYEGRVVVFLGSGKKGSEWNEVWGEAIRDSLEAWGLDGQVDRVGVADVRGVPGFIKGMVKRKFPKEPEKWALVDWDGEFAERYGWTKDEANILVFGADGRLAAQAHSLEPPQAEIRRILAAIEAAVAAAGTADPAEGTSATAEVTGSGADDLE